MVFVDLPFVERVRRIADAGFEVEIWDWTAQGRRRARPHRRHVLVDDRLRHRHPRRPRRRRGAAAHRRGVAEGRREARLPAAQRARHRARRAAASPCSPTEVVTPAMWLQAVQTLSRLAELGERAGRVFTLENLNTAVDHPGTPFAKAADTLALVEAVDSPHLRMNLDLYHAQIGEGNLVAARRARAAVRRRDPGRRRPRPLRARHRRDPLPGGRGRPGPPRLRRRRGARGLGIGRSRLALERFRAAFTV